MADEGKNDDDDGWMVKALKDETASPSLTALPCLTCRLPLVGRL